nr:cytochrome b561 domain-containing protein 2-like [Rhipicephalus microplus]
MANRASGSRSATAATLATTLLFSALVLYSVKPDTWRFLFPWHPTLAVLAFGLVTHPAVLLVRLGRTRLHWALQAAAIACALLACVAAFVHKAGLNKAHFTTWHAWTGLAALLLSLVEGIVGVAALTLRASTVGKQYPWLKYRMLRRVHRAMGLSAHGFATAAMVLGLRSNYGRQALAQALGTESLVLQLVVQALAAAPFASVVQHLYRGR